MKYGSLFLVAAIVMLVCASVQQGWYRLLIWPAASCAMIAAGYLYYGPRVFGKRQSGVQSSLHIIPLLPYLVSLWSIWHLVRLAHPGLPFHQLTDDLIIGRRLLSHELPSNVDIVVDMTCAFTEPKALRSKSYYSFQILDGSAPACAQLIQWTRQLDECSGTIYIHCAEGRGRACLFAAALLLHRGMATDAADAVRMVRAARPGTHVNGQQKRILEQFANCRTPSAVTCN